MILDALVRGCLIVAAGIGLLFLIGIFAVTVVIILGTIRDYRLKKRMEMLALMAQFQRDELRKSKEQEAADADLVDRVRGYGDDLA